MCPRMGLSKVTDPRRHQQELRGVDMGLRSLVLFLVLALLQSSLSFLGPTSLFWNRNVYLGPLYPRMMSPSFYLTRAHS